MGGVLRRIRWLGNDTERSIKDDLSTVLRNAIRNRLREKNASRQRNTVSGTAAGIATVDVVDTCFQHVLAAQTEVIRCDNTSFNKISIGIEISKDLVADVGGDVIDFVESDLAEDMLMSGIGALNVGDKSQDTTVREALALVRVVGLVSAVGRRRRSTMTLGSSMAISSFRDSSNVAGASLNLRAKDRVTRSERVRHLLK